MVANRSTSYTCHDVRNRAGTLWIDNLRQRHEMRYSAFVPDVVGSVSDSRDDNLSCSNPAVSRARRSIFEAPGIADVGYEPTTLAENRNRPPWPSSSLNPNERFKVSQDTLERLSWGA